MPAELPSTEEIFTETSRLVPLSMVEISYANTNERATYTKQPEAVYANNNAWKLELNVFTSRVKFTIYISNQILLLALLNTRNSSVSKGSKFKKGNLT